MSRGLGKTQRFVLQRLRELREQGDLRHHSAHALAAAMTGETDPAASTVKSVRQAIHRLEQLELVETDHRWSKAEGRPPRVVHLPGRHPMASRLVYDTPGRVMLAARLPLESIRAG
jgi:hypothetical protein